MLSAGPYGMSNLAKLLKAGDCDSVEVKASRSSCTRKAQAVSASVQEAGLTRRLGRKVVFGLAVFRVFLPVLQTALGPYLALDLA